MFQLFRIRVHFFWEVAISADSEHYILRFQLVDHDFFNSCYETKNVELLSVEDHLTIAIAKHRIILKCVIRVNKVTTKSLMMFLSTLVHDSAVASILLIYFYPLGFWCSCRFLCSNSKENDKTNKD